MLNSLLNNALPMQFLLDTGDFTSTLVTCAAGMWSAGQASAPWDFNNSMLQILLIITANTNSSRLYRSCNTLWRTQIISSGLRRKVTSSTSSSKSFAIGFDYSDKHTAEKDFLRFVNSPQLVNLDANVYTIISGHFVPTSLRSSGQSVLPSPKRASLP